MNDSFCFLLIVFNVLIPNKDLTLKEPLTVVSITLKCPPILALFVTSNVPCKLVFP